MPRSRPVDYPAVHPPTAQIYQGGLVPPSHSFAEPNRFSWQDSSTDLTTSSHVAEQQLEAGIAGRDQEQRKSTVPPLPVLPNHLGNSTLQGNSFQAPTSGVTNHSTQQAIPVQVPAQTVVAQQYSQQIPQQQTYFRPDVPRNAQQQQQQYHQQYPQEQVNLQRQPSGPPLSYEASQAHFAAQRPPHPHSRMQEQPMYPGHLNGAQQPMSAHAFALRTYHESAPLDHAESSDQKPVNEAQVAPQGQQVPSGQPNRPDQPAIVVSQPHNRPADVYVGPDVHPLSPTTPTMTSPTHMTRSPTTPNMNHYPAYPQIASFNPPSPRQTGGTWQTSMLSCSNPSICLPALACPCVIYGRTQYRLSQKSSGKDPTNMLGYSAINGHCVIWSVVCGFNALLTAIQHTRIRKKYEMQEGSGNVVGDCVKSMCCCCCIIAQDEREVKLREEGKIGGSQGTVEKGYTSPGAMVFSAPPH